MISSPGSKFTGECGEHQVTASEASSHKAVGYACRSHSYYPCLGEPSSAETSQHLTQTLPCGSHVGRACLAAPSHLSPVSCPQQDGKACSYGSYYTCSQHTHAYPKAPVVNPPPSKRPCGHAKSASGNHSWVSSCSASNANGTCTNSSGYYACTPHTHSYPAAPKPPDPPKDALRQCGRHYKSEGGDHRFVKVCSETNASGQRCERTSIGYWACDPHTHSYPPAPVKCGNRWRGPGKCVRGRVITGSDPEEHRITCEGGHSIWSCNMTARVYHVQLRKCQRSGCNVSTTKCQNGKGGCFSGGKEYKYHQLP